jgi:alpha-L-fucosidase
MADGAIPPPQLERLKAFGAWLGANGAAVYGTRPWTRAETITGDGLPVRITRSEGRLNLIALGKPAGERLLIRDLALSGPARRLADGSPVSLAQEGPDLVLTFARPLDGAFAPAVAVEAASA